MYEPILGDGALVAGLVPTAAIDFDNDGVRLCLVPEVAPHDLRARNHEHAFFALRQDFVCLGVDDGSDGSRRREADAGIVAALFHRQEVVKEHVRGVDGCERREFRAAVAFVNVFTELELECFSHFGAELFGAGDDVAE